MNAAQIPAHAVGADMTAVAWRRLLPLWLLLAGWLAFWYRDTAYAMWAIWTFSDTYTHGLLVVPIALWLAWRRRDDLRTLTPRPAMWALVLMAGAATVWFLADLVVVNAAAQFAFVALVVLSVPAILGVDVARVLMFPLGFLFFAVPFGDFLLEPMMEATADFTVAALRLTGVPVIREGLHFVIPSGSWSVVQECSGVRYLIASVMVGSLFAYLNYRSLKRRWIFVGVAILTPVLANWLRAFMIVMLGHLSNNKIATGIDHIIYGWVFFGLVIMIMFMIGMRWAEPDLPPAVPSSQGTALMAGTAHAKSVAPAWLGWVAAALIGVAPHWAERAMAAMERGDTPVLQTVSSLSGGWETVETATAEQFPQWKPIFENPSAERSQVFARDGQFVGLYVAYYRQQTAERKLISQANMLVHPRIPGWTRAATGRLSVMVGGKLIDMSTAELRAGRVLEGQRLRVWKVYWVNGRWVEGDLAAKVYGGMARLMGRGDESAIVVLYALQEVSNEAGSVLQSFLDANLLQIEQTLVAARDGPALASVSASSRFGGR